MGNPHKGEVEFTANKKVYTLYYSTNAMCELEEALGGNIVQIAAMMSDPTKISMGNMRAIFWAGLRDHHEALTLTDAGRLITELGIGEAMTFVAKAFTAAFPEAVAGPLAVGELAKVDQSTGKAH